MGEFQAKDMKARNCERRETNMMEQRMPQVNVQATGAIHSLGYLQQSVETWENETRDDARLQSPEAGAGPSP